MTSFSPSPLLANAHLQTIWPALFRRPPVVEANHEVWTAPDGEALDVEILPERPGRPVVLVLHGLEGSSRAGYVQGMLAAVAARGWNGVALNFRSCGPSPPQGTRLYHSGDTSDLPFHVERIRARFAGAPVLGVGFSMGGNAILKWLGEEGDASPLDAVVAVSVPFDLAACAAALDARGFWPAIYRERFLRSLRRKALRIAERTPALDREAIAACRTFAAFDGLFTAPMNGYASAEDYWARASSAPFLPRVRRPTLILSAEDDPFVPPAAIPREAIAANPTISALISARGGHVGFVTGRPFALRYAAEALATAFLERHLAA